LIFAKKVVGPCEDSWVEKVSVMPGVVCGIVVVRRSEKRSLVGVLVVVVVVGDARSILGFFMMMGIIFFWENFIEWLFERVLGCRFLHNNCCYSSIRVMGLISRN